MCLLQMIKRKSSLSILLLILCTIALVYMSTTSSFSSKHHRRPTRNTNGGHIAYNISKLSRLLCRQDLADSLIGDEEYTFEELRRREEMMKLLVTLRDVFHRHGAPLILGFGTLLGWYRECRLLPYTTDIDFLLLEEHYTPELEAELWTMNEPRLQRTLNSLRYYYELVFNSRAAMIDVFVVYNNVTSGQYYYGGFSPVDSRRPFRYVYNGTLLPNDLCSARLHDFLFAVPCDVVGNLVDSYGEGWAVIRKTFNWRTSPNNVEDLPPYTDEEMERIHRERVKKWDDSF